ncbi:MAG: hypothetical protein ACREP3_16010 [Candidatus Binatia bacterium]
MDLKLSSGNYLVTGQTAAVEKTNFSLSQFVRGLLRGLPSATATDGKVTLSFSPQEIECFAFQGKAKRRDAGKMPGPYSISQILRDIGSYLDGREGASLIAIALNQKRVSVRYQTATGKLEQAHYDLEYLYDYWAKMSLRRNDRRHRSTAGQAPSQTAALFPSSSFML